MKSRKSSLIELPAPISRRRFIHTTALATAGVAWAVVWMKAGILPLRDVARRYRISWKGHGGHEKSSDSVRLNTKMQQSIRDLSEITA